MLFDEALTMNLIYTIMFPFLRVVGLLVSMPIIGTKLLPVMAKVIIAMMITVYTLPVVEQVFKPQEAYTWVELILIGTGQFLVGVLMGFLVQMLFQTFVLAGQIIAMQMGLGFASMMDPGNGVAVPAVGQIYLMMVTLMYLAVDGHLFLFSAIAESFHQIPISMKAYSDLNFQHVFSAISWMFASSIKIVLPAVIALLLVNISLGIMTKAAPQLNIFSIGFPLTMIIGMVIIFLTLFYVVPHFYNMVDVIHIQVSEVSHGR